MHIPVLKKEVIQYLDPKPGENFIDCTFGEGGHSKSILEKNGPNGKVLGIEIDPELYENLQSAISNWQFANRLILINDSYVNLKDIVKREKFHPLHGVLLDLGISSWHLEESGRGFSFRKNEPLDMRYAIQHFERPSKMWDRVTAEDIVNKFGDLEIEKILKKYGQERFAKKIARNIANYRKIWPIRTTSQLVEIIRKSVPAWYRKRKIHFATRTFQALRIAVNNELENIKNVLPQSLDVLEQKGRIVVISFHSLEDRIVKEFFKKKAKEGKVKLLTKKVIRPDLWELRINPQSRSAKLRAVQKI